MTLVLSINTSESIWMMVDRRLSYGKGRAPRDDARKVMILEGTDGRALLGYAGLGATASGMEPADWMISVLRGSKRSIEQSLSVLAGAMKRQLPPHLIKLPKGSPLAHTLLITAFVESELRFYTIDLVMPPDRKLWYFRYTRHANEKPPNRQLKTPPISVGGSGIGILERNRAWIRPLLRIVKAYNRGKVSDTSVADYLSKLNFFVHRATSDNSVGPSCIVVWRNKVGGIHKMGGGQQSYSGKVRDASTPPIPLLVDGLDMTALIKTLLPHVLESFEKYHRGEEGNLDDSYINEQLALLPRVPDEELR